MKLKSNIKYRMTFILLSVSLWNDLVGPVFDGVGFTGFKSRSNAFLLAQLLSPFLSSTIFPFSSFPLRLAKNSYFQRKFTECSNNSRDTWKTLNCLIRCRKTSKDVTLNHNGSSISDPSAIAELFNNYFSNIASNFDCDIPHSNTSPLYFLGAPVENSFF